MEKASKISTVQIQEPQKVARQKVEIRKTERKKEKIAIGQGLETFNFI
jgi:hypothetical protein